MGLRAYRSTGLLRRNAGKLRSQLFFARLAHVTRTVTLVKIKPLLSRVFGFRLALRLALLIACFSIESIICLLRQLVVIINEARAEWLRGASPPAHVWGPRRHRGRQLRGWRGLDVVNVVQRLRWLRRLGCGRAACCWCTARSPRLAGCPAARLAKMGRGVIQTPGR